MTKDQYYIACRQIADANYNLTHGTIFIMTEKNFKTKEKIVNDDSWHTVLLHKKYQDIHQLLKHTPEKKIKRKLLKQLIRPYRLTAGIYEMWIHRLRTDTYPSFNRGLQCFINFSAQEVKNDF